MSAHHSEASETRPYEQADVELIRELDVIALVLEDADE